MLQKKLMIGVVILIAVGAGSAVYHNLQLDPYSGSTGTTASAQTTEYAANFNGSAVTLDKDTSYALGMLTAGSIGLPPDLSFDYTALMEGFRDFNEAKETRISQEQAVEKVKDTMTKLQAQAAEPAGNSRGNTATPASLPNPEPAANFHYDLTEDGSGIVINRYIGKNPNVVIPAVIEGYPVVEIGGFEASRDFFVSVVVPEGVRRIGKRAFSYTDTGGKRRGFKNLTSVTLPSTLISIGAYAFAYSSLRTIKIPDSVEIIEEEAFANCRNLTDVNIPAGIKFIYLRAFYDCRRLSNLTIPDSVISIEWRQLTWLVAPAGNNEAFLGCALTLAARRRLIELGHPDDF